MRRRAPFYLAPADRKVVGLVGVGHFASHFYFLVLPPLFPVLTEVFAVSYTQLGFALSVMAVTSAVVQTPVGFLVDRYGARPFLAAGLVLSGLCIIGVGVFATYEALLLLMVLFRHRGLGDPSFRLRDPQQDRRPPTHGASLLGAHLRRPSRLRRRTGDGHRALRVARVARGPVGLRRGRRGARRRDVPQPASPGRRRGERRPCPGKIGVRRNCAPVEHSDAGRLRLLRRDRSHRCGA